MTTPDTPSCRNKALDLLSRRDHFRAELRRKLLQRGFAEEEVEDVLDRLADEGFLDDESVARRFAASRRQRRGEVGRRLVLELRRRGVDGDLASRVVDEMDSADEADLARETVERLRGRGATEDAIGRHLDRKGFPKAVILDVLSD